MPKSCNQSIDLFMACDELLALVNKTCNLIGLSINSYLSLALISLVDTGITW